MFKTSILFIKRLGITYSNFLAIGKTDGISNKKKFGHIVQLFNIHSKTQTPEMEFYALGLIHIHFT